MKLIVRCPKWWGVVLALVTPIFAARPQTAKSLLSLRKQPLRCDASPCAPEGDKCENDDNCVTDKCYLGKCGAGPKCRLHHEVCYQYAAHTCCSGKCTPVVLQRDCTRLLGITPIGSLHAGINLDRQCEQLGVCAPWPGADLGPGPLTTPWAVRADDLASKYWNLKAVTFDEGAVVRTDLFVARKIGQTYHDIDPSTTKPASMNDAGVIIFSKESTIELDKWAKFDEAGIIYCVAPITVDGIGGGFFAVGKGCCDKDNGFTCDDAPAQVKSGIVLAQQKEKYAQALTVLDGQYGGVIRPKGKGITTRAPIFVRIKRAYMQEIKSPPPEFVYVYPMPKTYCVAPIWKKGEDPAGKEVNFWAAGVDCCTLGGKFECGDIGAADARSGENLDDPTGELVLATHQAEMKLGIKLPTRSLLVTWTEKLLVPPMPR